MAAEELWYFAKDHLMNTPSRKCGIDPDKELSYRQQAANFIQDMGQRLNVNQLCINTAIVYMHRFYMFHPFTKFHRNSIATCALFLAAKVEEQPRKLEHVIRVAHMCLHRDDKPLDAKSEAYLERAQELVGNENIMLPTLGFDVAIDHPHTHVVKCCQLVRASKDLAQTSYFMATNSLHLTTMCLQYKPTVVACVCIHLACKWANWEIRRSSEGKDWFWYVDKNVTSELLEELTAEFLAILDKCPSRLKRKIKSATANKSDKDGTSGKKSDDTLGTEEYTMADMNQYHDLRIDRADWKEVTRSSKSAEKAKASEERKAIKIEPGLVPPSPQFPLKTPSPQKTDQSLPVTATDSTDASRIADNSTPSPSMHKKQKLSTPKQSREKKDAERRELRERERVIAQSKQNIKTEKERSARISNQHIDAVVASVSSGEVPKSATRPPPVTPVPTHPVVSASVNNNHKQHDPALERRKNVQLPGSGNDWKDPSVRIENSHANGRHVAVPQQQQLQQQPLQTQVVTQPMQQHCKESDSAPQSLVLGFNMDAPSNTDSSQMKHREHRSHGSRGVNVHHNPAGITAKVHAGQTHAVDAKDKDKMVKHHRSKTPPAALMELGHQQPQHQFLPVSSAATFGAQAKQEPRVPLQMPNFQSPNGGGASATEDNNPMDFMLQNLQTFSNAVDSNENRGAEKSERKEKHKHKNRSKERSKTRDRDKDHGDVGVANPVAPGLHQGIKLTIPKDKLGCGDDEPDASGSIVAGANQPVAQMRTAMLPVAQHSVPSLSHHVHQSSQGPGPSPPKAAVGGSLKIKIPKDKLLTPKSQNSSSAGRGGLKITISKARLNAASAFQVLDAVVPSSEVAVAPPPPVINVKESRKRAAANKDVASTVKPKVARQAARSSKASEQMAPTLSVQQTATDMNAVASSQMSNLTPFQASLMTTPEASLRPFPIQVGQNYNHGGMMMSDPSHDTAPKMVAATRRGGHSKRGGIADNVAAMSNVFHQMNAGPYPYQPFYHPYQNHYFHQPHVGHPQSDFRYFPHNRPPMPPPLPSGPPPEAPPPPPPPPLHE